MIKRFVARAAAEGPFDDALPEERVRAWTRNFAPNVARRMTRLGLMLGETLRDFSIEADDAVVYATTFAETIATERYLGSFPAASPLFFQTSIHPSAIEQVLINRACPVRELTPLAGQPHLPAQAALTALLTPGHRVLLTGGEEIGTWLRDLAAASRVGFSFALELTAEPTAETCGEVTWHDATETAGDPSPPHFNGDQTRCTELFDFFLAVRERRPWRRASPAGGTIGLQWSQVFP